ncbi:hypothetical protein [Priestia abyssalis]|uniref:hypothetical protein n=1 Tax=Priestia abyssalis TaxID=1221450 RepID=UPI001472C110|nr:hypothetical protein [Priestia abyssalis]
MINIEPKEIERIIDDFETKADGDSETLETIPIHDVSEAYFLGKRQALKYAAKVLRQVL